MANKKLKFSKKAVQAVVAMSYSEVPSKAEFVKAWEQGLIIRSELGMKVADAAKNGKPLPEREQ